jgi:hypothetical protein
VGHPLITIGVDIGQRQDPTAIVLAELADGMHTVRHLERRPLGTSYPEVAERIDQVYAAAVDRQAERFHESEVAAHGSIPQRGMSPLEILSRARDSVYVFVDATGCGLPVVDFVRQSSTIPDGHLTAVMFTAGEHCTVKRGEREGSVAKAFLVSRIQALLGSGRLALPDPEARILGEELADFWRDVNAQANAQYGAKVGAHDDLVCALGLAVLLDEGVQHYCGSFRYC